MASQPWKPLPDPWHDPATLQDATIYVRLTPTHHSFDLFSVNEILTADGKVSFENLRRQVQDLLRSRNIDITVESFEWRDDNNEPPRMVVVARPQLNPTFPPPWSQTLSSRGRSESFALVPEPPAKPVRLHPWIDGTPSPRPRQPSFLHRLRESTESDAVRDNRGKRRRQRDPTSDHEDEHAAADCPNPRRATLNRLETDSTDSDPVRPNTKRPRRGDDQTSDDEPVEVDRRGLSLKKPRLGSVAPASLPTAGEGDAEVEPEVTLLTQPALAPDPDPTSRSPPTDLPSWNDAGADCPSIGRLQADQGHDDALPELKGPPNVEGEGEANGQGGAEHDEDKVTQEILENEKKLRRVKEHSDPALLEKMHALFKTDAKTLSAHDAMIPLRGLRRPLMIHQAYGAFYILWAEMVSVTTNMMDSKGRPITAPGINYMYLADEVGYGKSATVAAIIVLCRWLEEAWSVVDRSRLCCPCVEANPSSKMRPVRGIVTFVVPTSLLINSVQEWYQQVDMDEGSNELGFEIHVQTTTPPNNKANIARLMRRGCLESVDLRTMLAGRAKLNQLQARMENGLTAPVGFLGHIFFCSPDSYNNYMVDPGFHALPCGRFLRDEFHQQPGMENVVMTRAREAIMNRWRYQPVASSSITLMSGTPIRMGAQDLYGAVSVAMLSPLRESELISARTKLEEPKHWEHLEGEIEDPFWRQFTPWGLSCIKKDWNHHRRGEDAQRKRSSFITASMIARGRGSRWMDGETLMPVPRMRYRLVTASLDTNISARIWRDLRLSQGDKRVVGSELSVKLLKCGTFPALSTLARQTSYEIGKEWMDKNKVLTTKYKDKNNVFRRNIYKLTRSSAKLISIADILDEMLQRKDFMGRPAKGIIFTESNEAALIIQLWIEKIYSVDSGCRVRSALVYGGMDKGARQQLASDFQDGNDVNLLIGVASGLGTGVTLTRAMFTILVEQVGDPGTWTQMIGRMLRKGNQNWHGVLVFELYLDNWQADATVRGRRRGRNAWAKAQEQQMEADFAKGVDDDGVLLISDDDDTFV